jgi:hypothetical protein
VPFLHLLIPLDNENTPDGGGVLQCSTSVALQNKHAQTALQQAFVDFAQRQ